MGIDVKVNWSMSDWRRFFGLADVTPLVELASLTSDRLSLAVVHRYLEKPGDLNVLKGKNAKAPTNERVATKRAQDCRSDQATSKKSQNV